MKRVNIQILIMNTYVNATRNTILIFIFFTILSLGCFGSGYSRVTPNPTADRQTEIGTGMKGLEPGQINNSLPASVAEPTEILASTIDAQDFFDQSCLPNQNYELGIVTKVVDGDTIRVQIGNQNLSVRYIGIDAPDTSRPTSADHLNRTLVEGEQVALYRDVSDVDRFGRILRYVFVGEIFVNYELVKQGQAIATSYPPDTSCNDLFSRAQADAKTATLGIWSTTQDTSVGGSIRSILIVKVNKKDEYVDIQNVGNSTQNLAGWELVSERGDQTCLLSGLVEPNQILRIYSLAIADGGVNCGFESPIWSNSETDVAILYDELGNLVSIYP